MSCKYHENIFHELCIYCQKDRQEQHDKKSVFPEEVVKSGEGEVGASAQPQGKQAS